MQETAMDDLKFNGSRRHFLSAASLGIGSTALASLLDPLAARRSATARGSAAEPAAARGAAPPCRASSASSTCSRRRPVAARPVRLQAAAAHAERPGAAGVDPQGPAPHRHDGGQKRSRWPARSSTSRSTASPAPGSASCCRTPRRSPTSCASSVDAHRGDQPRPGHHLPPDRIQQRGRPSIGRLAHLRPRLRERRTCPAFIVLMSRAREGDQPLYSRLWGSGFLPSQHQGVQFRGGRIPCSTSTIPTASTAAAGGACSTRCARSRQQQHARVDRPGDRRAHRAVRDGLPDADGGARPMDLIDEPDASSTLRPRGRKPGTYAANCLLRGGWPSATCASSSSITAAGTSTAICPRTSGR